MPVTEVNKLERELEKARNAHRRLVERLYSTRWHSGGGRQMVFGTAANKLRENITRAANVVKNAEARYNAALNRNANSLQAQSRELMRAYKALHANSLKAREALSNLNAQANKARANGNAQAEANIEQRKIIHRKVLARLKRQSSQLSEEMFKLNKAIALRKRVLSRPLSPEAARRRIGKFLTGTLVARTTAGPYGTRTLSGMRNFPNYRDPTLEQYAEARREIGRLQRLLRMALNKAGTPKLPSPKRARTE